MKRERGIVGGGRWEKARGKKRGRKDWFIGAEERDQGRMRGRGRMVEWSRNCVCERERKGREEGQGCNWWKTWPTPPSLQWSESMPLPTPASPPSIHSCLHLSLQFSHSMLLYCFSYFSYAFQPSIAPSLTVVSILLAPSSHCFSPTEMLLCENNNQF